MKDYRRYHCDENKLTDYGFNKQGHNYIYKKNILLLNLWWRAMCSSLENLH